MTIEQKIKSELHMAFILSGKSFVRMLSTKTGVGVNYKVQKHKEKDLWFVYIEHKRECGNRGPDETIYYYLGMINESWLFAFTRKSHIYVNTKAFKIFAWVWYHITHNTLPEHVEIKHLGRCGRCGYKLKDKKSVERGFGPYCWDLISRQMRRWEGRYLKR